MFLSLTNFQQLKLYIKRIKQEEFSGVKECMFNHILYIEDIEFPCHHCQNELFLRYCTITTHNIPVS